MPARVTVKGAGEIAENLRRVQTELGDAIGVAMHEEAVAIMADARDRAPVGETGELRDSGYVTEPDGPHVEAGFGANHAIIVHERTDLHHDDGEAKFLERAIDARASGMSDRIVERAVELLEGDGSSSTSTDFPTSPPPDRPRIRKGRSRRSRVRAAASRNRRRR